MLFLPAILSANFLGMENIIFKIALGIAFIISNGYLWAIFQHEVDHLNGMLFVQHLSRLKQERARKKLDKLRRQTL